MIPLVSYKSLAQDYDSQVHDETPFETIGPAIAGRGYMTKDEFLKMVRWKSARALPLAKHNSHQMVETVSRRVFAASTDDSKVEILCELSGVGVRMASAILTIVYPQLYGVVDVRAWRALSDLGLIDEEKANRNKSYFSTNDFVLYLHVIRRLAVENGISPREIDKALWKFDEGSGCKKKGSQI